MKAYMGYSSEAGSSEGACLVFAHNAKEARSLAHRFVNDWVGMGWLDTRVRLIKDAQYLFAQADQKKLEQDVAHVIDSPQICKNCEMWGTGEFDIGGVCADCQDNNESEQEDKT